MILGVWYEKHYTVVLTQPWYQPLDENSLGHFDTVTGWRQNSSVIFYMYGTVHQQKQQIVDTVTFFYRPYSDAPLVAGALSNLLFIVSVTGAVVIMSITLYEMSQRFCLSLPNSANMAFYFPWLLYAYPPILLIGKCEDWGNVYTYRFNRVLNQ